MIESKLSARARAPPHRLETNPHTKTQNIRRMIF